MKVDSTYLIENAEPRFQSNTSLRIGAFEPKSQVAGPGVRAVLWVTGCNRRCPGCIKPEFLPFNVGATKRIEEVAKVILACKKIDGVTYSGGEPFEQSRGLAELSRIVKAEGLNILAYSGYTLSSIIDHLDRFGPLLEQLDWLVDGEYRAKNAGPLQYIGSDNQRLLKKQADGSFVQVQTAHQHEVQISFSKKGIRLTGFPDQDVQQSLTAALASRGVLMVPARNGFQE